MTTISLKLPKPLLDRVQDEARNRRRSRSAVIRDCLDEFFFRPKRHGFVSCYDLAPHLAGSVKGPPDLARNKDRYLRAIIRKEHENERKRAR